MKKHALYIIIFFCFIQQFYSQEDGVVAFSLPVRNSLKFNRYAINPTFSFVREQNKYISFTNKREWVQFDDAPQTYLFSYSGRFAENAGAGIGLFQQNYGVLTTFGGVLNFAYNAVINRDSNLTFGINLGFYKSGINEGSVITNFPDPSLQNLPSNSILTANPGINYGTTFLDFGVSLNNIVSYNLKTSEMIEDNPEQSLQAHVMYTGYLNNRGFFDESKFSGLVRSEFKKDITVVSGIMMLTVPKGIWAQVGYNSLYGASGGIGMNITNQIAIEYNYEKAIGDLSTFGNSHEFTVAYKFKSNNRYIYSDGDDEGALIAPAKKKKRSVAKRKPVDKSDAEAKAKAKADEEARRKLEEEAKATAAEEARLKLEEEAKAKADEEARLKLEEEAKAKADEDARLKLEEEAKAKAAEEERLRLEQEALAKEEAEEEIKSEELDDVVISVAKDETAKSMESLTQLTVDTKIEQQELLDRLRETVASREQDLKDLKEENDLSEQGIYKEPKPFKSISAENAVLESLKNEIDNVIKEQDNKIVQLESLYSERLRSVPNKNDSINTFYKNTIETIKSEQSEAVKSREDLLSELEEIKAATEVERKRRIKRATYDNEEQRYQKDRTVLNNIKQNTPLSSEPLKVEDFDFGEEQGSNIQIVKGVNNTESGYYMVIAVHTDVAKRDEFLRKAVSAGQKDIDFFYDVTSSKYFIYNKKYDDIESAINTLESKGTEPYNSKMSMVKIEN